MDSRTSNLLQAADLVANTIYQSFKRHDDSLLVPLASQTMIWTYRHSETEDPQS